MSIAAFATRGSRRWLQVAVNRSPELLDAPLRQALDLAPKASIQWLSPLAEENFTEFRDLDAFSRLGVSFEEPLSDFWPPRGPMWDGLARTSTGEVILVEAKAHIQEMISTPTRASEQSRALIRRSLRSVQQELAPRAQVDWSGTFYQYANRVAHLHFLRVRNRVPAHLVFVYFLNASDVRGPSERAEWEGAIRLVEGYLGLGRHRLARYVHKVFVDVSALPHDAA